MKYLKCFVVSFLLLTACSKNIQTSEAVKEAVLTHLSANKSGLNMGAMDLDVTSATYRENDASVTVGFRVKGSSEIAMSMAYQLQRDGNKWVVKNKEVLGGDGASPHGAQAPDALPPGHPPLPDPTPK